MKNSGCSKLPQSSGLFSGEPVFYFAHTRKEYAGNRVVPEAQRKKAHKLSRWDRLWKCFEHLLRKYHGEAGKSKRIGQWATGVNDLGRKIIRAALRSGIVFLTACNEEPRKEVKTVRKELNSSKSAQRIQDGSRMALIV